jgi:hypothetical protein
MRERMLYWRETMLYWREIKESVRDRVSHGRKPKPFLESVLNPNKPNK